MTVLSLWIPGRPLGKPRQRFRAIPTGKVRENGQPVYAAKAYRKKNDPRVEEEKRIGLSVFSEMVRLGVDVFSGPVAVSVVAVFKKPKSISKAEAKRRKWHTQKPDVDNVCGKTVLDACNGVLWHDDTQVAMLLAAKVWTDGDEGYLLTVRPLGSGWMIDEVIELCEAFPAKVCMARDQMEIGALDIPTHRDSLGA